MYSTGKTENKQMKFNKIKIPGCKHRLFLL